MSYEYSLRYLRLVEYSHGLLCFYYEFIVPPPLVVLCVRLIWYSRRHLIKFSSKIEFN